MTTRDCFCCTFYLYLTGKTPDSGVMYSCYI